MDDVIHNVFRRVIDAARFANFRLLLDADLLGRNADGLAEIALVNRAQKLDANHVKAVGTPRRVEAFDDFGEHLGIYLGLFEKRVGLEDFAVKVLVYFLEERPEPIEDAELAPASFPFVHGVA